MDERINRTLSREHEALNEDSILEKKKAAIIGISEGAGASFLTMCFARALANRKECRPAVVELGQGSLYDSMGMDKRFSSRDFFPFYQSLSQGTPIKGKKNMDEGINWVIKNPEEYSIGLDAYDKLKLIHNAGGNIILCDFSGCVQDWESQSSTLRLLQDMDIIFAIIDPMPSKLLSGYGFLQEIKALEARERPVIYLINKYNSGINKKEMLSFLKVKKPVFTPVIPWEELYRAEYNCKNPYSSVEVKKIMEKPVEEILSYFFTEL